MSEHEYRHNYTVLPQRTGLVGHPTDHDAAFVDDLIESIGDQGRDSDWQVVRIKVYEDTAGRRWVHSYLKRPITPAEETLDRADSAMPWAA